MNLQAQDLNCRKSLKIITNYKSFWNISEIENNKNEFIPNSILKAWNHLTSEKNDCQYFLVNKLKSNNPYVVRYSFAILLRNENFNFENELSKIELNDKYCKIKGGHIKLYLKLSDIIKDDIQEFLNEN
jgi:hypothetical protein